MVAWRYQIYLVFEHSKINFVSPRGHVISSLSPIFHFVEQISTGAKPKYRDNIFCPYFLSYFCFLLYSLPLGSAYCLSISLKRILLIQVYIRSRTPLIFKGSC